ncbi:hypothetical protein COLO4_37142 [Corchorus olitorius]|uniref:Uncharacterized protein n=1 Tax=Corchorus olitorius TaxID=93759 RepID=A0A1R3G322_9ROSI|nr:hypothetical protein COLO4_37142 [Corchorus olitorius]
MKNKAARRFRKPEQVDKKTKPKSFLHKPCKNNGRD